MNSPYQRWRYYKSDGTAVWLAFDPNFLCIFCDRPVGYLSMGGPAICPACDCGISDGQQWTMAQFVRLTNNAKKRLDAMKYDPTWDLYEGVYKAERSS